MGGFANALKRFGGAMLPPAVPARTPPFLPPGTSTAPMRPPMPNLPPQGDDSEADDPQDTMQGSPLPPPVVRPRLQSPPPPVAQSAGMRPPPALDQPEDMPDAAPPPPTIAAPVQDRSRPPSWSNQAAKTEQARQELENVQRPLPPEPKGVRKYLGAFVDGGVMGVASEALRPGQRYAQQKYGVQKENAQNKYGAEEKGLQDALTAARITNQTENTESLKDDRNEKHAIARERIAAVKSNTYRQDIKARIGKREEDASYQAEGDPRPEGTEYIPNDEKPGFGWVVPAAYAPLPKELAPFLPGHKEGQVVPYSKIKKATDDYNKSQLVTQRADLKPDQENPNRWMADALNPDPAISGPAKQKLKLAEDHQKAGRTVVNVAPPLVDAALDRQAVYYHKTGKFMPGMARNKDAQVRVANREAELFQDSDLADASSQYSADSKSEGNIVKQADSVETFANTARKNLQLAVQASAKVDRTGSPIVNKYLNFLKGTVAGDADTHVLEVAVETAANEYAKVTSGQTSGTSTDSARNQARGMLNAALSKGTLAQTVDYMNKEMESRTSSYAEKRKEIQGRRSGKPGGPTPQAAAPQFSQTATDPKTGKKVGWDGKSWQPIN